MPEYPLQTSLDAIVHPRALNERVAIYQMPSSLPDSPEYSAQGQAQDSNPVASTSANSCANDRSNRKPPSGGSTKPLHRQPVLSEQPSISKLLELGVKVRDFAYESTLPPVPTVHLQPPQNVPNDIYNVLEECKKEAYSLGSTREIQRIPTEPMLNSECISPEGHMLPRIKRTNALLDLNSQSNLQPLSYLALYDATSSIQSASQPIEVGTSIVSSDGSVQWSENSALTAVSGAGPSISSSQINSITAPSEFVFTDLRAPVLNAMAVSPISHLRGPSYSITQGSSKKQVSEFNDAFIAPISLPPVLCSAPPARSNLQPFSSRSLSRIPPSLLCVPTVPCYSLRRNKRRAESPPSVSPDEYYPPRKRLKYSSTSSGTAIASINATGRMLRRSNGGIRRGSKISRHHRQ